MEVTLNKNENYTWKFVKKPGNIMEFCHCGKMGTLYTRGSCHDKDSHVIHFLYKQVTSASVRCVIM